MVTSVPVESVMGVAPSSHLNAAVPSAPAVWILIWIGCDSAGGVLVPPPGAAGCAGAAEPPERAGVGVGEGVEDPPPPVCSPNWKSILSCS